MKKSVISFIVLLSVVLTCNAAVLKFKDAFAQASSKMMFVLVYASWAPRYQAYLANFRKMQKELGNAYNYVELDITTADAAAYNQKFDIYRNLPYVIMLREGGRIQRYIDNQCSADLSCMRAKMKAFTE